jgi:hypothetical protein
VDKTGFKAVSGGYGVVYDSGYSRSFYLEAATNFFYVFNMSATMARQGGRVQLEQSDRRLALNMAKMAKLGFSGAAQEEMQQLINTPCAKVREEKR